MYHNIEGVSPMRWGGGESPEGGVPPRGEKVHSGGKGGHPSGGVRRVHLSGECHPTPEEGYSQRGMRAHLGVGRGAHPIEGFTSH